MTTGPAIPDQTQGKVTSYCSRATMERLMMGLDSLKPPEVERLVVRQEGE